MAGFDFGAAGGGAVDTLQQIIKQKLLEQVQRHQMQMAEQRLSEDARQANMQNDLGQGQLGLGRDRLGLDRDELGERRRQFDIEQPIVGRLRTAQAADLERKPQAESQERAHEIFMEGLGNTNRIGQIDRQGNWNLRGIGAQGAEARKTATLRLMGQGQQGAAYANERTGRIRQSVSDLKNKVSAWTAGPGSLLASIPATDARNFAAELNTLKSNIAFGELQEMRAASKTGGALGAVSERELSLLESSLGALDQGQSPANLAAQLQKIEDSLSRWEQAKAQIGGGPTTATVNPNVNTQGDGATLRWVPGKGWQ